VVAVEVEKMPTPQEMVVQVEVALLGLLQINPVDQELLIKVLMVAMVQQ